MSELKLRPRRESGKARGPDRSGRRSATNVAAHRLPLTAYPLLLVPVCENEIAGALYAALDTPALFRF